MPMARSSPNLSPSTTATGPNMLFIAIDDLRPELVLMPPVQVAVDQLAQSGMLFQQAYCQQAVCGASRLSIMGGLYPTLTKEQTFHVVDGLTHPDLLTLNQHFKNNGYRTLVWVKSITDIPIRGDPRLGQWVNIKVASTTPGGNLILAGPNQANCQPQ